MAVGIVIVAVLVLLLVVMRWADKRDRAKGHVNRRMGDIRATMRADRTNLRNLRRPGGYGASSPHTLRSKDDRFRRR